MTTGDEVIPHATGDPTRPPTRAGGLERFGERPDPIVVLGWVAAAGGRAWFPSRHAAETGIDRDALDDPLSRLRLAGLVRIATWERGAGQGYELTRAGAAAVAIGLGLPEPGEADPEPAADEFATPDSPFAFAPGPPAVDTRPPLVALVLLVANLLWFFAGVAIALRLGVPLGAYLVRGDGEVLHRIGAVAGPDLIRGDWWRLVSSCFVHIGGLHLLVNLFALAVVGPAAELLWGRTRLVIIYLVSGLAGSCLAMGLHPEVGVAGASGAIWGVLASILVWLMLFRAYRPPELTPDASRRLAVAVVLNVGFSFVPGISWQAHLGGAAVGFAAAVLLAAARRGIPGGQRAAALLLLAALPVACVGGLVAVTKWGGPWAGIRARAAALETARRAEVAIVAYNRDVAPLLDAVNPDAVKPVEAAAAFQLIRARRNAEAVAAIRAKLVEMKAAADEAAGLLAADPVGVEALDRHRARAREFAETRARSFALALDMLAAPAVPDAAAWAAWSNARRAAAKLWTEVGTSHRRAIAPRR